MIDLSTPNEWQHKDESLGGILFPWYTKSFLEELVTWDLKGKVVFEYGAGASSLWWAKRCKRLFGVESNAEWFGEVARVVGNNTCLSLASEKDSYVKSIYQWVKEFDIIVVDGDPVEWRDDCIVAAIDCIKNNGVIICDNWQQRDVWISDYALTLLCKYDHIIYRQSGHDHWQTACFKIIK